MPALNMLGLGDPLRGDRLGMVQNFVAHFVFVQTIDELLRDFHGRLRSKLSLSQPISTSEDGNRPKIPLLTEDNTTKHGISCERLVVWLYAKFARMNMTKRSR